MKTLPLLLTLLLSAPAHAQSTEGRAEALVFSTAFGLYQGVAISILLDDYGLMPSGDNAIVAGAALTLLTTAGSFAGTWAISEKYGVNEAQARVVNSSFTWAMLNAGMLSAGVNLNGTDTLWTTLISGWTGQGLGILLAANVDRTPGQVGLMNTVATWSGAETAILMGALELKADRGYFTWPAIVADAGLLTGSWIASRVQISDSRARMLDLGALAGGLAAPAALFMVWGPEDHLQNWYLGAVAVGVPAGIALAWHLTQDWDAGKPLTPSTQALMVPLWFGGF